MLLQDTFGYETSTAPLQAVARAGRAAVARILGEIDDSSLAGDVRAAIELLEHRMPGRGYQDVPPELAALVAGRPAFLPLMLAGLIASIDARAALAAVPAPLHAELARQCRRILDIRAPRWEDDAFRKDLGISLTLSLPCVAQVAEYTGSVPRAPALRRTDGGAQLARHILANGLRTRPYLEIHTHTPMLDGFNEGGWLQCYRMLAEVLRQMPDCLGVVGGSWFYDPAVARISPRLSYLSEMPLNGGAFRVRIGASEDDRKLATATSATRRALAESGEYIPTKWLLVWPRKALLRWADAQDGAAP